MAQDERLTPKRVFQILKGVGLENDEHYSLLFQGLEDNARINLGIHPLVAHILSRKGYNIAKGKCGNGSMRYMSKSDMDKEITTTCMRDNVIFIAWPECFQHKETDRDDSYSRPIFAAVYMDIRTVKGIHTSDEEFVIEIIKEPPLAAIGESELTKREGQLIKDMEKIASAFGKRENMRIQEVYDFDHVSDHNRQPRSLL